MPVLRVARPVSLAAFSAILLSPGLWLGAPMDSAVFVLAGVRIRDGYAPYRDLWDHKPPGVYLLNALGQTVLPWLAPWLVSWLLTVAFTAAAILVFDRLLQRRLSAIVSFLWSLVCLVGIASYPIALGGGLTESFAILPLIVGLWAIVSLRPTLRLSVLIGSLLAFACLMSLQCLPAAAVLFVLTVFGARSWLNAARRAAAAVAGGVSVASVVVVWLLANGALGNAFDQVVTYNEAYRSSGAAFARLLLATLLAFMFLLPPMAVAGVRMGARPRKFDRIDWSCLGWGIAFAVYVVYQERIFLHYWILMVPPAVLLASSGTRWIAEQVRTSDRGLKVLAVGLSIASASALSISALSMVELYSVTIPIASAARDATIETSDWITANTPTSATVFVWGDDPNLYLVSHRSPYDVYVYQIPLVTPGYWTPNRTAMLLSDWASSPPSVIVESPSPVPMFRPRDIDAGPFNYDALGPLRDFVRSHYALVASFGDHDVYVPSPGG
jgi:hypothetical protein